MMVDKSDNFTSKGIFSTCRDINDRFFWTFIINKSCCFTTLFVTQEIIFEESTVIFGAELFTVRSICKIKMFALDTFLIHSEHF